MLARANETDGPVTANPRGDNSFCLVSGGEWKRETWLFSFSRAEIHDGKGCAVTLNVKISSLVSPEKNDLKNDLKRS